MRTPFKFSFQLLTGLGVASCASLVAAQSSSGAVLTYGPLAVIPTLGGGLLIALAALLMLIAIRRMKDRPQSGTGLAIALIATVSLATGAGGLKLMADAYAAFPGVQMTAAAGGRLNLPPGESQVINATQAPQAIKSIQFTQGCSQRNRGPSTSACSTSSVLAPQSAGQCDIEVFCPCAYTWNPNFYVDFSAGDFVGSGNYWSDQSCTVPNGNLSRKWVYSPSGQANATNICVANLGAGFTAIPSHGPLVFECVID